MTKEIIREVKHYTREALSLREDVPGARMWAVALEKTMLTYFEIQPNSRFEHHSHESEQITLVLEGELFFELSERTISVNQGEVIAIPSCVPHTVYTKEKSVKAVDAWSPVMENTGKNYKAEGLTLELLIKGVLLLIFLESLEFYSDS